jgi:hypothetical protein
VTFASAARTRRAAKVIPAKAGIQESKKAGVAGLFVVTRCR